MSLGVTTSQQLIRLAAYGVVEVDGRVLLARAGARSDIPGTWSLPGGGVDHGEHPEAAVVREVREETGLVGRVVGPPTILSDVIDIRDRGILLHSVRLCYPLVVEDGPLRAELDGSTDQAAWVPREDVAALPTLPFVPRALGLPGPDLRPVAVIAGGRIVVGDDAPRDTLSGG